MKIEGILFLRNLNVIKLPRIILKLLLGYVILKETPLLNTIYTVYGVYIYLLYIYMYAYINSMCNRTSILSGGASLRAVWGVYSWPDGSLCPGLRSIGASVLVGLLPGSSWWVVKSLGRKVRCPFFVGSLGSWSCFLSFKVLFLLKLVM